MLKLPTKPLTEDGNCADDCPVEIAITEECIVTSYHRDFNTIKKSNILLLTGAIK